MEKSFNVKVSIDNPRPMYDDDGIKLPDEKFQELFINKIEEVLREYIEDGLEIDFINSEFGSDDAEDFKFYGEVKVDLNG